MLEQCEPDPYSISISSETTEHPDYLTRGEVWPISRWYLHVRSQLGGHCLQEHWFPHLKRTSLGAAPTCWILCMQACSLHKQARSNSPCAVVGPCGPTPKTRLPGDPASRTGLPPLGVVRSIIFACQIASRSNLKIKKTWLLTAGGPLGGQQPHRNHQK